MIQTIFIHGYNFDLAAGDDPDRQYVFWREFSRLPAWPHRWQSLPEGGSRLGKWFRALSTGRWNTYTWAYAKALKEAQKLAEFLDLQEAPVDLVCHSLGSRIAYELARLRPAKVRKVLAFNGADESAHARKCALAAPGVEFYSVMFRGDKVLGCLGRVFSPKLGLAKVVGYDGMQDGPPNWHQIVLEPDEGANPDGGSSHSWSFANVGLWPRWREILRGDEAVAERPEIGA